MKRTLLMVVQTYLDRTSGFYVNSIFESDEAQQVAKIAEDTYYQMIQEYPDLLFTMKRTVLDAFSDVSRPNFLLIPSAVQRIQESEIYYNTSKTEGLEYKKLTYLPPREFMGCVGRTDSTNTIIVEGLDKDRMAVNTKQFPTYFTSFDNVHVVFDSYNSDYDTTLQSSKTLVVVSQEEPFLQEDDFEIPVPATLSETYLNMFLDEAMSLVYQQANPLISRKARAARIKLQQDNRKLGGGRGKTRYGRSGHSTSYVPRGHRSNG